MVKDERRKLISQVLRNGEEITSKLRANGKRQLLQEKTFEMAATVDRGWAWMVLFGSCVSSIISAGMCSNIGVLYVDIQKHLGISMVDITLIGSLQIGFMYLSAPLTGAIASRFGCRVTAMSGGCFILVGYMLPSCFMSFDVLLTCLGVLAGVGISLSYFTGIYVINEYFDKRRSFAFLINLCVSGVGILIFGPLTSFLLDIFGLRGTLLFLSALGLNTAVGASLFYPVLHDKNLTEHQPKTGGICEMYMTRELWVNPALYLLICSSFMYGIAANTTLTFLPKYIVSHDIPMDTASLSISAIGVASTLARLLLGFVSDNFPGLNRQTFILCSVLGGVSLCFIPLCRTALHFLLVAGVYGIFFGAVAGLQIVLVAEIMGKSKFPASFGIVMLSVGVASLIGSPVAGTLAANIPVTGVEYFLCGTTFLLNGLILLPTLFKTCLHGPTHYLYVEKELHLDERQPLTKTKQNYYKTETLNEAFSSNV